MKKSTLFLTMLIVFAWPSFMMAQDTQASNNLNDQVTKTLKLDSKDALILEEDNCIHIEGQKAEFINFSVTKKLKVKILSEDGVNRFSRFCLPEKFDPSYLSHFPEARNYTNALADIFPNYFKVKIITKEGQEKEAEIYEHDLMLKMVDVTTNYYGNYIQPCYDINNLAVGDELEVEYDYYVRYMPNILALSSFRVFFHNDIYKEDYHLKLIHHDQLEINIDFMNGADPDTVYLDEKERVYEWREKNLADCLDEAGSRPYMELPNLVFSITPYEFLYTYYFSFEERFIPFYAIYATIREKEHLSIARSVHQGVTNSQYSQVNKFIKNETKDIINDTLKYQRLMTMHHTIAEDFSFANDIDYFKKTDTRRPRFGDYTTKRTIRDISRYDIYACLIRKLDLPYYTAYMCDIRMGEMTNEYFAPMKDNDYMFAVILDNNTVQYVHPKQNRYGYYLNEYPFYYEGAMARLVNLGDYRNYKDFIQKKLRQIRLPNSVIHDNERRTSAMVHVNIDSALVDFKVRMNVSGQYSTMSRGLYLYDIKDKTVNELYNTKVWELNENVKVIKPKVEVLNKEFPFATRVTADYTSADLTKIIGDTIHLDLSNMFNHIIDHDLSVEDRHLNYYPDFVSQDTYVYYLKFDEDIKLLEEFKEIDIKNEYGELKISINQLQPRNIKISSSFIIKKRMVLAENIDQVESIFSEIRKLNSASLKLQRLQD